MTRRSLRNTLLTWNAGVVVSLLGLFGLGVTVVSQYRLRNELDHELERQARHAVEVGPPPQGPRPGRDQGDVPERFRPLYEPARRLADIRQPRFINRDGFALLPHRGGPNPGGRPNGGPNGGGPNGGPVGPPNGPGGPPQGPFGQSGQPGQGPMGPDGPGQGGPEQGQPGDPNRPRPVPVPRVDEAGFRTGLAGWEGFHTVKWEGEDVRVFTTPIYNPERNRIVGVVQIARELRDIDELGRSQLWTLVLFLPLAAAAAGAAAFALANRALRPIAQVTRTASEIGGADLSRRLEVVGDDELAEMARTFNGMLGRLDGAFADLGTANERLARALDAQRRFTADASHELRTPLTRLRLAADVGKDPLADEEKLRDALAVSQRASGAMARLVDQLLTLARVDAGQLPVRAERFDLRIAVAEALDGIPGSDRVQAHFPDHAVTVQADPDHIRRIVTNLVENALRHTQAPRRVALAVTDAGRAVNIEVHDEGVGIPRDHLPRVFDRFHRVDASRTGTGSGLGLAICRDLVHANGGQIHLESQLGKGTKATVTLPKSM